MDMSVLGSFLDEKLFQVNALLLELFENAESVQVAQVGQMQERAWFADLTNYVVTNRHPCDLTHQQRKRFVHDASSYLWDAPHLFKVCNDQLVRRCVPDWE